MEQGNFWKCLYFVLVVVEITHVYVYISQNSLNWALKLDAFYSEYIIYSKFGFKRRRELPMARCC